MKILIVPDTLKWAIGHLVEAKVRYNTHHTFKIVEVHPRDAKSLADDFERVVKEFNPDIIHYEYFRSAEQLINAKPFLKNYTSILTHHNQRDKALFHADWKKLGINMLVTHTNKCKAKLVDADYDNVEVINHGVDQEFFSYSQDEPKELRVGYAGRIVPWKRLKDVAKVCCDLDYKVLFMGKQDKPDYWATLSDDEVQAIDFTYMDCKDEDRLNYYRDLTCYVGFSDDDYEEGTLELLEAMSCGVPVVTTPSGVARDICKDGHNCLLVEFGDIEGLKVAIKRITTDSELRKKLRKNAWDTVRNMTEEKMAYEYSTLYHKVYKPDSPLASVIVPTYNRGKNVVEILRAIKNQTYPHIETIICDDNSTDGTIKEVLKFSANNPEMTIKVVATGKDGYNLAMARNMGAIVAEGKSLIFIDSRLKPDENAVMFLAEAVENASALAAGGTKKVWFFGNKGSNKMSFVENFSSVSRELFMNFGMMNERIDSYGGLSQEIRTRWNKQGGQTLYIENAMAEEQTKASSVDKRRESIREMKFRLFKMYGSGRY